MARGVARYLVGSLVVLGLAACGKMMFAEREAWRHEAEVACLKSGQVKEGPSLVRIQPISGPGICGADFPLKVAAIGEGSPIGYADELRPPGAIPHAASRSPNCRRGRPITIRIRRSRKPIRSSLSAQPIRRPPRRTGRCRSARPAASRRMRTTSNTRTRSRAGRASADLSAAPAIRRAHARIVRCRTSPRRTIARRLPRSPTRRSPYPQQSYPPRGAEQVPLGRERAPVTTGAVAVQPTATLACPIVSALDTWFASGVQPAAMKWFGVQVAEIRQISAYSCRGMNGQPGARISEHAFGNALDIASFTLADGRRITVKDGWRGAPEEQGFLRDVQGSACQHFSTVLAPGSNAFHYDHIHVDLMRRASGRQICNPAPVPGDVVAARAGYRFARGEPAVTGSIKRRARAEFPQAARTRRGL